MAILRLHFRLGWVYNGTAFGDEFPMQLPIAVSNYLSGLEMKKYKYKSAEILPKNTVSSNLFLSNKSFHRFERHIIFKLMTYCCPNSIALTAIDNDLLILKQWKGALLGHQKLSFFKYIFQRAWQAVQELSYLQNGTTSWGFMGKCRSKV